MAASRARRLAQPWNGLAAREVAVEDDRAQTGDTQREAVAPLGLVGHDEEVVARVLRVPVPLNLCKAAFNVCRG